METLVSVKSHGQTHDRYVDARSVHTRWVPSAGRGKGLFDGHCRNLFDDRGLVVEVEKCILPRAIYVQMLDYIGHDLP